jgi:hypothetical protein
MKFIFLIILPIVIFACSHPRKEVKIVESERIYKGLSIDSNYVCYLKVSPDNSVNFVYGQNDYAVFGEHSGTISRINDSTFHVKCKLDFGHYINKAFTTDSFEIWVDSPNLIDKSTVLVQYDNDELMTGRRIDKDGVTFAFDPELFSHRRPALILTNHIHPFLNEPINIKAYFGSASQFVSGDEVEFDVLMTDKMVKSIGEGVGQTGHFELKRE